MYITVEEGRTKLKLFADCFEKISKSSKVFFNPRMKLNRDITIAVVRALGSVKFLDLLAASGAKGIRVAKEAGAEVALNDINPRAVELIKENLKLNGIEAQVFCREANLLLNQVKTQFNFIDIDPFGTPVPFIDNAVRAVANKGVLGITATDTAPLCGVYPKVCLRKYQAIPVRGELCKEAGLRILLGYCARVAAKYSRAVEPLLSHATHHYFRIFFRVVRGARRANKSLENLGYLYYCRKCRSFDYELGFIPEPKLCCGTRMQVSGLMWLGSLKNKSIAEKALEISEDLEKSSRKLLEMLVQEEDLPFYHDIHTLAELLRLGRLPKMQDVIERISKKGFRVSRAHALLTAIKTDMPREELIDILQKS